MCGITGYVDFSSSTNRRSLDSMIGTIAYRGPDSSGRFISKSKKAALGIRRLSIIDLKTGDQPIFNEDSSVVVVYNGEIYNYLKLKRDLIKKGHKFRTKSDTEVLVHLYEEYGLNVPKYLNAMFAFAIWDENKQELLLARDRAGIKPLYYYHAGRKLIFGSEVKTILAHPDYNKKVDNTALSLYGNFGYIPSDFSVFKGVKKLLPGHALKFSKRGLMISKYFELSSNSKHDKKKANELLQNAVTSQLISDVPVGVFLSGGIDSSLIAYHITQQKRKLNSFSISFDEKSYDESNQAQHVAKKLGTKHHSETFTHKDITGLFPVISSKLDEPLADPSLFPTFKVSKLARKHVKVVLSGDGGDELFGGYPTYQAHLMAKWFEILPKSVLDSSRLLLSLLPNSHKNYDKKKLATVFMKGLKKSPTERHFFWMRTFFLGENNLFDKPKLDWLSKMLPDLNQFKDITRQMQVLDFYTYLRDDFLFKVDRASMYNSLEVRVPFLDNDVIDFAFSTDLSHVGFRRNKIILRDLLKDKLPEIANRPKKGFGMPIAKWMMDEIKDFSYQALQNKKLYDHVDKKEVKRIWNDHQKQRKNNAGTIWMLIMLSGWLDNWA